VASPLIRNPYDELAHHYDSARNFEFYRALTCHLKKELAAPAGGRALDLACGSGFSTEVLVEAYPELEWDALDASSAMLERARARPSLKGVRFTQGLAEKLPYAEGEFDWVACNFGFHWFKQGSTQEILRVLKPGGLLAMTVPMRNPGQGASGNDSLRREILSRRGSFLPRQTQGLDVAELQSLFSDWKNLRLETAIYKEELSSLAELASTLASRGSLHAVFGENPANLKLSPHVTTDTPLVFDWRFAILQATRHH
jgi:ubiquinone/menaquinone biosynthesis C-methylase UbiE